MAESVFPPYVPRCEEPGRDLIHYAGPVWDSAEIEAACSALREGKWLTSGAQVTAFERAFSRKFKHGGSLMVNSGSSANLIMLAAAKKHFGWQDGAEVIVSVVGFPTTVAPLLQLGLRPVFADIELSTLNFDLHEVESAITPKTRAILISPVLGNPPHMRELSELAKSFNKFSAPPIHLLLDGCDSLGSEFAGMPLPSYCSASSCSFFPAHHICTGEGGMVSSDDAEFIKLARRLAHWGRDCYCVGANNAYLEKGTCGKRMSEWLGPEAGPVDHRYVFTEVGYNLKPLDMQGAIGLEQLKKWDWIRNSRRSSAARLSGAARAAGLTSPAALKDSDVCWFGVPFLCESAEQKSALTARLDKAKIQWRNYFAGNLLLHPGYSHLGRAADFPNANEVLKRVLFLGCSPHYDERMLSWIEKHLQS